jgi:Aromatic-ring-opening dioxygenase LigAB, LigA subunit
MKDWTNNMSLYQLQKLIYEVNRNPERRDTYRADLVGFLARYQLTPEEQEAIVALDVRKLYRLGVHPLLLRPFTLLHRVSNEDYAKALAGLE